MMVEKSLTVLEIGSGKEFKRALKTAREHPNWHVIAIDPQIKDGALSPLTNLTLIHGRFPHPRICKGDIKIDRVEMYHMVPFFRFSEKYQKIDIPVYEWLNNDNPWLAKKHEICIIDNNTTQFYHEMRESFMRSFEIFKKIFERKGYEVVLEEISKKILKLSQCGTASLVHAGHVM